MKGWPLVVRNFKEVLRDPLSLGINVALPVVLLLTLQVFSRFEAFFHVTVLTPGIALFGFVMLMLSSAMILSRDRESALFTRLLTAPLRPNEFLVAYSLPYLPVALAQAALLYGVGALLGLRVAGSPLLVILVLAIAAVLYIALGMIMGTLLDLAPLTGAYTVVLLLTIFGGAWMDLEAIGGVFKTIGYALPFAHALNAVRAVMIDAVGLAAIAGDLLWVVGYTVASVVAAVLVFRRRMAA